MVRRVGDTSPPEGLPRPSAGLATAGRPIRAPGWWSLLATARSTRLRRDRALAEKTRLLDVPEAVEDELEDTTFPDERLGLIFGCHPALGLEAQVALTFRALGGLRTDEIARAFLVPEPTMKRRAQGVRFKTAWPCSRSAGTDTWSCTTSQTPSIRRKHAVQRTHRSVM
jgi:predicted RNA polymerase sigma factor